MPAPVCVFAFNRPDHLQRALAALSANDPAAESDVFIFCDGPRNDEEKALTDAVRKVARSASGFKSVTVKARSGNRGLAASIISGVTRIVEQYGTVIVVEDDLVTSPYFLRYMNDGLRVYAESPEVASIHGWCFPHAVEDAPETFFLRGADCWGWATWKRVWDRFEPDAGFLLKNLKKNGLIHAFNCNETYDYAGMLADARDGRTSSWAVRWRASTFLHGMYSLHPGRSLVRHTGGDGTGTNVEATDIFDVALAQRPISVEAQEIQENAVMRRADMAFHSRFHAPPSLWRGLKRRIRVYFPFLPTRGKIKQWLKDWLPPALSRLLRKRRAVVRWEGNYPDWESAVAASGGYAQEEIFIRTRNAARAVRDGKALWERDSVLFYHEEYNWPLLAALLRVAALKRDRLHVLDFGGAFGSAYMQHRSWLDNVKELSWNIVEQRHIVNCGNDEFMTGILKFWPSIENCTNKLSIDFILFSSVLQYLEYPFIYLKQAIEVHPKSIFIDRMPIIGKHEYITIQHVSEPIYVATYPCRFFKKENIENLLNKYSFITYTWFPSYNYPDFYWSCLINFI
jgi:putative methyltransferase (TIGR04325 family)